MYGRVVVFACCSAWLAACGDYSSDCRRTATCPRVEEDAGDRQTADARASSEPVSTMPVPNEPKIGVEDTDASTGEEPSSTGEAGLASVGDEDRDPEDLGAVLQVLPPAAAGCDGGEACGECSNECEMGSAFCDDGGVRQCVSDDDGCRSWSASTPCDSGLCSADSNSCVSCPVSCVGDDFRCDGAELLQCRADDRGCTTWVPVETCENESPVCDAEGGRCMCDESAPVECSDANSPEACIDGIWTALDDCDGETPACRPGVGCTACDSDADCPESACRYVGPDQGACFDVADVVNVSNAAQLELALDELGAGATRVIRLAEGHYDVAPLIVEDGQEVAFVGSLGTTVTRSTGGQPPHTFSVGSDSKMSLSNLTIADGTGRAIGQASSAELWVQGVRSHGYEFAIDGAGDRTIRGSALSGRLGVIRQLGGQLRIENTSIGPSEGTGIEFAMLSSIVDIRYATIAGNAMSLTCSQPYPSGIVRNSILVGTDGNSIGGNTPDSCRETGDLSFIDNAVDQANYGVLVGAYDASWYIDPDSLDFHLTEFGVEALTEIADWDTGDPLLDIDGDPRPTDVRGHPGVDEP